ncbi:unnamed protein product [Sphenostylis stenocarpa]|uniref:Uncharacterized protein n=1 Tax=Sphenostylis stenocarpa TaxID=92480 RepID=A0AA86VCS6_9FABA|nr:unnamed protein product [Sphenostylis stenocarpa]
MVATKMGASAKCHHQHGTATARDFANERCFLLCKTSGLVDDPFLSHYLFAEELVHTSSPRWQWDLILEWEKHGTCSESVLRLNVRLHLPLYVPLLIFFCKDLEVL